MSRSFSPASPAGAPHRYGVRPLDGRWALTRDGVTIGVFSAETEALAVGARITEDISRGGVEVVFAAQPPGFNHA